MSVEDSAAAYRAAKESAAVFDLAGWTKVTLTGRDSAKFLHNFCTNDIKGLKRGEGCEAFLTNVKARVLGHGFVFPWSYGLSLFGAPGQGERLAAHLDRYVITEDVKIRDLTGEVTLLYLVGARAAERLAPFVEGEPSDLPARSHPSVSIRIGGRQGSAVRVDFLGMPGFLISTTLPWVETDRAELIGATGAIHGAPEAFESLRIEAAFPLYGIDITEDQLAPEVGRPWAISYDKGCYLGQEPIARIDALGHVNRLLCGLRLDGGPAPERGAAVLGEGKEIGSVTSATVGLADGKPVALAYLRAKFADPGTAVAVRTSSGEIPATVYRAASP
jgi:folate-binding protein YgfZ